jgi:hypothetical protein
MLFPFQISLIVPGDISITELLVRMQFAIYTSTSEPDMILDSESGTVDEGESVIIEGEEETEVPVEDEGTEVVVEGDEENGNIADYKEESEDIVEYEKTEVSNQEPSGREVENNEKNVNDKKSPEIKESVRWSDLIEEEESSKEVFLLFVYPQGGQTCHQSPQVMNWP